MSDEAREAARRVIESYEYGRAMLRLPADVTEDDEVIVARALLASPDLEARNKALEEAARLVESRHPLSDGYIEWMTHDKTAAAIRALKESQDSSSSSPPPEAS